MIGIHINNIGLEYKDCHNNKSVKIGEWNFTISFHGIYDKQVFFENDTYIVLVDGWIFNAPEYKTQAEFIIYLYNKYRNDIYKYLNGQFNIVIISKKNNDFILLNDIYAFRKHFYYSIKEKLVLSSDYIFINNNVGDLTLNKLHISNNLKAPRIIDEKQTFINEINQLPSCSFLSGEKKLKRYSLEGVERQYYRNIKLTPDLFLEEIREEIKKVHRKDKILLHLSGGIDSRFLLEVLLSSKIDVATITYGNKISDEVIIAEQVAKSNNLSHISIPLFPRDFLINSLNYIKQTGGLDIFVQSMVKKIYKSIVNEGEVIDTGFALDMFLGGTQIEKKVIDQEIPLKNSYDIDVKDTHYFSYYNRVFSVLALRQSGHREYFEDRYSMYSYPIYFLMKNLGKQKISQYKFYYELLKKQVTNSFNIPILSTMFDLNLPPNKWKEAAFIQFQKEKFTLEFYNKYKKPLYHNRYYSDFDMWLRVDENWNRRLNFYLLSEKCIISKDFIEKDFVVKTVNDHVLGRASNIRNIIRWLSTEIFLREFYGKL